MPTEVKGISKLSEGKTIVTFEAGGYHNFVLLRDSESVVQVVVWGRGDVGQLGLPKCQLLKDQMGHV
jgi:alpha-tubulin suppressor-like RCC1 family protein